MQESSKRCGATVRIRRILLPWPRTACQKVEVEVVHCGAVEVCPQTALFSSHELLQCCS